MINHSCISVKRPVFELPIKEPLFLHINSSSEAMWFFFFINHSCVVTFYISSFYFNVIKLLKANRLCIFCVKKILIFTVNFLNIYCFKFFVCIWCIIWDLRIFIEHRLAFDIISLLKILILNNKLLYQKCIKNFLFNIISLCKYFAEWFISKWLNLWSQIVSPVETCVHTNYLIIILKFQDYGRSTLSFGRLHFMI